jgi:phosphohistidine phosphatase SixA
MSRLLVTSGWRFNTVFHSPLVRAAQTASIVSGAISENRKEFIPTVETELLKPGMDLDNILDLLGGRDASDAFIFVFHMPDVAHIASYFLGLPESSFYFTPGSMIALNVPVNGPRNRSMLIWCMQPEHL